VAEAPVVAHSSTPLSLVSTQTLPSPEVGAEVGVTVVVPAGVPSGEGAVTAPAAVVGSVGATSAVVEVEQAKRTISKANIIFSFKTLYGHSNTID
jgi:hypothetical protein